MNIRIIIIFVLFGMFLKFFGFVSFQKYLQGGIMIDRKQKYPEELDAPSLMVCGINANNGIGWKNFTVHDMYLRTFCENAKDSEEFLDCIEKHHLFQTMDVNFE